MTNPRQDRVPGQTLAKASAFPNADIAAAAGVLFIRLNLSDEGFSPPGDAWTSKRGEVYLASDLVTASGGVVRSSPGPVLAADFPLARTALLTARRLMWALGGYAGEASSGTAVIAVCSRKEEPELDSAFSEAFENTPPGHILLSPDLSATIPGLPGLTLRAIGAGPWHELVEEQLPDSSFAAEEAALLGLNSQQGPPDPVPPPPEILVSKPISASRPLAAPGPEAVSRPATLSQPINASRPFSGSFHAPAPVLPEDSPGDLLTPRPDVDEPETAKSRKPLIVGVCAIAAVLIAVSAVVFFHKAAPPAAQPASPLVDLAKPPADQATRKEVPPKPTHSAAARAKSAAGTLAVAGVGQPAADAKKPGVTEAAAGGCDLPDTAIDPAMARAQNDLHAGHLSQAQDEFQYLVNCPTVRAEAQKYLQIVKDRLEEQK